VASRRKAGPNQALQQTGHATDGYPGYTPIPREPAAELGRSAADTTARGAAPACRPRDTMTAPRVRRGAPREPVAELC